MSLIKFIEDQHYKKSDKYSLGYIHEFYDKLFSPIQTQSIKLLEIGIHHGDSIRLWNDFFTASSIFAVDIKENPEIAFLKTYNRVNLHIDNAYDKQFVNKFDDEYFDVIIDDGPHTYESQRFFLENYLSKLKTNGIMILEDIIETNKTQELYDLIKNVQHKEIIHMSNKCKDDFQNIRWSSGLDVIVIKK